MSREKTRLFCPGTSDLNWTGKGLMTITVYSVWNWALSFGWNWPFPQLKYTKYYSNSNDVILCCVAEDVFQKFVFLRSLFAYEFAFYAAWAEKVSPDFFISELSFNDFELSRWFGIDIDPVLLIVIRWDTACGQHQYKLCMLYLQTPALVLYLVPKFLSITYKTVKSVICPEEYEMLAV